MSCISRHTGIHGPADGTSVWYDEDLILNSTPIIEEEQTISEQWRILQDETREKSFNKVMRWLSDDQVKSTPQYPPQRAGSLTSDSSPSSYEELDSMVFNSGCIALTCMVGRLKNKKYSSSTEKLAPFPRFDDSFNREGDEDCEPNTPHTTTKRTKRVLRTIKKRTPRSHPHRQPVRQTVICRCCRDC